MTEYKNHIFNNSIKFENCLICNHRTYVIGGDNKIIVNGRDRYLYNEYDNNSLIFKFSNDYQDVDSDFYIKVPFFSNSIEINKKYDYTAPKELNFRVGCKKNHFYYNFLLNLNGNEIIDASPLSIFFRFKFNKQYCNTISNFKSNRTIITTSQEKISLDFTPPYYNSLSDIKRFLDKVFKRKFLL